MNLNRIRSSIPHSYYNTRLNIYVVRDVQSPETETTEANGVFEDSQNK